MTEQLSDQQAQVITLLLAGKSQRDAAAEVGIAAETVTRWKSDSVYVATMNARRQEVWATNTRRLRALLERAIVALGDLLDSDNEAVRHRVAMSIIKANSLQTAAPGGETDPERLAAEWERNEKSAAYLDAMLDLTVGST